MMTKHEEIAIAAIGALTKAGELLPEDVTADDIRRGIERLRKRTPRFLAEECEAFAAACRTLVDNPGMGRVQGVLKGVDHWTYMAERASSECPPPRFGSAVWLTAYHEALSEEGFPEAAAQVWELGLRLGVVHWEAPEYFTPEELREQMREYYAAEEIERRALKGDE